MKRLIAFWGTVLISWQYVDGASPATGFKVSVGTAPGIYQQTVDVPGGDKRSVKISNVDGTKLNYAAVAAYNEWGQATSSPELAFGGAPSGRPFSLAAAPTSP